MKHTLLNLLLCLLLATSGIADGCAMLHAHDGEAVGEMEAADPHAMHGEHHAHTTELAGASPPHAHDGNSHASSECCNGHACQCGCAPPPVGLLSAVTPVSCDGAASPVDAPRVETQDTAHVPLLRPPAA